MVEESKDCLQCRLTSGCGLLAGAAYVLYQSKKLKTYRRIVTAIGCGLGALGILRLFALPPFKASVQVDKKGMNENVEENEYIIGKFPPKLH